MVKFVVKGLNYTKIETDRTVQFWMLKKGSQANVAFGLMD